MKLSASALSCYLESPRRFYWQYIKRLEPLMPSTSNFDHDKIAGSLWSEFVDRFYKSGKPDKDGYGGITEAENIGKLIHDFREQTDGWCGPKVQERLTEAMLSWGGSYYQLFDPSDGCRNGSEKFMENDRFLGYLDGLSHDLILHEVKSTSRSKQISEQLWKVQNSLQVKLYCVLAEATGIRIEFAWKDAPYGIYRSEVKEVTPEQRKSWEQQLNALADHIYSLGDDPDNYACHSDGCCITTKNFVSVCEYQALCDYGLNEITACGYKHRTNRRVINTQG
jgi:hypothetical protein